MADSCDAFLVGAKILVFYQRSAPFDVSVQQWHADELYSMILEHEGCKASAPIDESSRETVHLGEMAAEASVVCRPSHPR